jgi:D-alanine transaminase
MIVYLNGSFVPHSEAKISVDDRGFVFADGIYEVIRAYDGRLFLPDEHMRRMRTGLASLRIDARPADILLSVAERLLDENELGSGDATVYMQVTRGAAPRKHAFPPADVPPTVFAIAKAFAQHPVAFFERGVPVITVPDTRWSRCDIKSISLLPNVLANQQAKERGAFEAVFVKDGTLIEGSHSNLFGVVDGELRTYPECNYILGGITRTLLLDIARELRIPVREAPIFSEQLGRVEELFLSGTTTEVMPVTTLDDQPIAGGVPGPITLRLMNAFRELVSTAERAGVAD